MLSRGHTLAGQFGNIPYDEYFRKIEQFDMREDPMGTENYMRSQLTDYRPDAPFFESDQKRDPSDRGSGNGSRERLSLRYTGARTEEEPYLPDGTFLDHEFMERDPRGTQNLPDFNKARQQRLARAAFIKFSNDEDYSVPETAINPVQMVSLITQSRQQFKDRYKNFDESMDAWHNGGTVPKKKSSSVALVTKSGTVVNLSEATGLLRQDPVNVLSNRVKGVPRWTETDQRVKVSRYGQVRPVMDIGANKWNNNRSNSYLDHSIPVEINGERVNKLLGMLIVDLENQRSTKQELAKGVEYGESMEEYTRNAHRRLNPADIYKLVMIGMTGVSQAASAHQDLDAEGNPRMMMDKHKTNARFMLNQATINHEIAASMSQANRKLGPKESKDMRESIKLSAADNGIYTTNQNRGRVEKSANRLERSAIDERFIEEEKEVQSYSSLLPAKRRKTHEQSIFEAFGSDSKKNKNRFANQGKRKHQTTDDLVNDIDMEEFGDSPFRKSWDRKNYGGRSVQDAGDIKAGDSEEADNTYNTRFDF